MSYYIMSDNGQLLERQDERPTQDDLRTIAEEYDCDVWVIEGEHAGIGYDINPHVEIPLERPKPRLVFGQPIPPGLLDSKPEQKTLSLWRD